MNPKVRRLLYLWALAFTLGMYVAFLTGCRSAEPMREKDEHRPVLLKEAW